MKNLLCLFFLAFLSFPYHSQTTAWQWARSCNGAFDDEGRAVAIDSSGNVLMAGNFESSTLSLSASVNLTNQSVTNFNDIFLAKYDSSGTLLWAISGGGNNEDQVEDIVLDASGNIFLTGYFNSETLNFAGLTLSHAVSNGYDEPFVAKLDPSGNGLWIQGAKGTNGSTNNIRSLGAVCDASGCVYITGYFEAYYMNLGTATLTNSSSGTYMGDLFIAKYNPTGSLAWAQSAGGTYHETSNDIAYDGQTGIYIVGDFHSNPFNLGTTVMSSAGFSDIFYARYDTSGNPVWAKSAGGPSYDHGYRIATDQVAHMYVAGSFESQSIIFPPFQVNLTGPGGATIFAAKMDWFAGTNWVKTVKSSGAFNVAGIEADQNLDLYLAGKYEGGTTITIDSLPHAAAPGHDLFVSKFSSIGTLEAFATAGSGSSDMAFGFEKGPGACYLTGRFSGSTMDFNGLTIQNSNFQQEPFIAKIGEFGTLTTHEPDLRENLSIHPNPAVAGNFFSIRMAREISNGTVELTDLTGRTVLKAAFSGSEMQISSSKLAPGMYWMRLWENGVLCGIEQCIVQ